MSPQGMKLQMNSFYAMFAVVTVCRITNVGPAAWVDQLQADYLFSGAYSPALSYVLLSVPAVAISPFIGFAYDIFVLFVRKRRQGQALADIPASIVRDSRKATQAKRQSRQAEQQKSLRWKEPASFRRAMEQADSTSYQKRIYWALAVFVLSSVPLVFVVFRKREPIGYCLASAGARSWPLADIAFGAIILGVSTICILLVPYFNAIEPAKVLISSEGIRRDLEIIKSFRILSFVDVWLWDDIDSCAIELSALSGKELRILTFSHLDKKYVIALGKDIKCHQLESVFAANNKALNFSTL